jgi:glucose/mannose transport system substrate-binding protein
MVGPWLRELADERVLGDVSDIAQRDDWGRKLPPVLMRNITVDKKVVAVPLSMHGTNWVWFNRHALQRAGIKEPRSWEEILTAAESLKRVGIIPFALSSQSWQVSAVWVQILAGVGGRTTYERYIANDSTVFSTLAALKAFTILARMRDLADSGSTGRSWSGNAALISTGRAAFMFMGDWVKGEFQAAGRSIGAGADIGCMLTPGADDFYMLSPDVLAVTSGVKTETVSAQRKLATVAMSPDVQRRFALEKNGIPARMDIDAQGFDECAAQALSFRSKPGAFVLSAEMALRGEVLGAVGDVLARFWGDSTMTPEQAAQAAGAAMKRAM